jgi:hypothetical protein
MKWIKKSVLCVSVSLVVVMRLMISVSMGRLVIGMGMTTEEPKFVMTRGLLLDYERRAAQQEQERIIKLLNEQSTCFHKTGVITVAGIDDVICNCDGIALIKGEK